MMKTHNKPGVENCSCELGYNGFEKNVNDKTTLVFKRWIILVSVKLFLIVRLTSLSLVNCDI